MSISSPDTCCLHLTDVVDNIIPFSKTTWTKVTDCIPKWISLGGAEAKIASNLQNISVDSELNVPNGSTIDFHQRCYNKFPDKTRIEAAQKRLIRLQKDFKTLSFLYSLDRIIKKSYVCIQKSCIFLCFK